MVRRTGKKRWRTGKAKSGRRLEVRRCRRRRLKTRRRWRRAKEEMNNNARIGTLIFAKPETILIRSDVKSLYN
jgi:hypothetical protein